MKSLVPYYSCLQNPRIGRYRPQIPVLSVPSPQLNLLNSPKQNSWVRHCLQRVYIFNVKVQISNQIRVVTNPFLYLVVQD